MKTRTGLKFFVVGLLALGLVLPFSVAKAESDTIKIGSFASYSGVFSKYGTAQTQGIELAIEDIEKSGGLLGKKIELITADHGMKPADASRRLRRLVERDKVNFVIGPISSGVASVITDIVEPAKVITVITVAGHMVNVEKKCSKYVFKVSNDMEVFGKPFGTWVAKNLGKKIYILGMDYAAGHQWCQNFEIGAKEAGAQILGHEYAPMKTADFAPFFGKIKAAKPDVLAGFFAGPPSINFVKQADAFGLKDEMKLAYTGVLTTVDALRAQGPAAEGIYTWFDFVEGAENPEYKAFAERITVKYNVEPWFAHFRAYIATKSALEATRRAGSLNPDKIAEEMVAKPIDTPLGDIYFNPGNHQAIMTYYVRQVKDGKNIVIDKRENIRGTDRCEKF
jgi:branched-chain amino acid transport system substrate-binding protein